MFNGVLAETTVQQAALPHAAAGKLPGRGVCRIDHQPERVVDALDEPVVAVRCTRPWSQCPHCGFACRRAHDVGRRRVRDLSVSGRPVTLMWHRRRFAGTALAAVVRESLCPSCALSCSRSAGQDRNKPPHPADLHFYPEAASGIEPLYRALQGDKEQADDPADLRSCPHDDDPEHTLDT